MWSDNETNLDLISIGHYVSSVVDLVHDEDLLPLTIGIFGDWGNGKSSLLKMVKDILDKEKKTLCLYFNGWLFEDYDDAKAALMGTILDEIEKKPDLGKRAKDLLKTLRTRVNWLGLMGVAGKYGVSTLLGGPIGGLAAVSLDAGKHLLEKIKNGESEDLTKLINSPITESSEVRNNIHKFREEFSELLKESSIDHLVVIIDDLDRCLPDTIINTLEAVKLFLSSKGTAFLISIDERVIKHAISIRYSNFNSLQKEEITRDYLEKLIQIPLRIPLMNKSEMKSYINLLFASKHLTEKEFQDLLTKVSDLRNGKNLNLSLDINWFIKNTKADDELKDELMITEQINDQLYDFLKGNPRQVKRFINTLILRMKMASIRGVDLKKQVLAKLMALEYMNVGYFRQLADWQSIQAGKPKEISALETQVNSKTKQKDEEDSTGWLENDWVKKWLKAEPLLRDENLEPYFYISRDAINSFATLILELTEQEKQIFDLLVSPSEVHKTKGKKLFESVSDTEAINITKAIIDKCSKSDLNVENKGLPLTTVSLMYRKANVSDNILDYINTVDEEFIEPAIILELKEAQKKASASVNIKITALLDKFRKSTNAMLAKAVDS